MPAVSGSPARGHVLQPPKATSAEARADFLSETSLPSILVLDFNASLHALRAATGFLLVGRLVSANWFTASLGITAIL